MRGLARLLSEVVDEVEFWLPALGLLLIGTGILVTILHVFGRAR
jgi:hypothetical protein